MVTFSYLNLAIDPFPSLMNNTSAMDIIFCRNVLMYFTQAAINRVVEKFSAALVENGWFMVSPAESSLLQDPSFGLSPFGAILFQKRKQTERIASRSKEAEMHERNTGIPDPEKLNDHKNTSNSTIKGQFPHPSSLPEIFGSGERKDRKESSTLD